MHLRHTTPIRMPVLIPDLRIIRGITSMAMEVRIKAVITKIPVQIIITEAANIRRLMLVASMG